jgi:hypothetical protein
VSWYVRSTGERDTHSAGGVHRDGSVVAVCGARFRPLLVGGRTALPGHPPDPEQVCPACRDERPAGPRYWYLRSPRNLHDAHFAAADGGAVRSACGAVFTPAALFTAGTQPAEQPPDPRACATCQDAARAGRGA